MEKLTVDKLVVTIANSNDALGVAVAEAFSRAAQNALKKKPEIAVILATGNSQLSFARAVRERDDIEWSRITILHMDEYLGMSDRHPASFRRWIDENIVSHVSPKAFEGVRGDHEPADEELDRYALLLVELAPSITVMGIGENGHLAFNDPPADFEARELVRIVEMDEASRRQQVGEGHFASLSVTPTHALSLTIPALLRSETVFVGCPEKRKAKAVKAVLEGSITPVVPASILRRQENSQLFLDQDSASMLDRVQK